MLGYVFRNANGTLYFTEFHNVYKDEEKGRWRLGKGIHALQLSEGNFPSVKWDDALPTQVELRYW